jgi:hypothetical protein
VGNRKTHRLTDSLPLHRPSLTVSFDHNFLKTRARRRSELVRREKLRSRSSVHCGSIDRTHFLSLRAVPVEVASAATVVSVLVSVPVVAFLVPPVAFLVPGAALLVALLSIKSTPLPVSTN